MWKTRKLRLRKLWPLGLVVCCLLVLAVLLYTGIIWPNTFFAAQYSVQGLDVSSYQRQVDWRSVARTGRYAFVFIKATEGKNYKDAYFQANWRGTEEQGLLRGAYHFYNADRTGAEQAHNYISVVPREAGMLPPVLDLEVNGRDQRTMLREIKIFLDRLQDHYGQKPVIYTDHERYEAYIKGHFDDYVLWIRDVLTPIQWSGIQNWTFWQYCSRGHVPGVEGYVDINAFSGGRGLLERLALKNL